MLILVLGFRNAQLGFLCSRAGLLSCHCCCFWYLWRAIFSKKVRFLKGFMFCAGWPLAKHLVWAWEQGEGSLAQWQVNWGLLSLSVSLVFVCNDYRLYFCSTNRHSQAANMYGICLIWSLCLLWMWPIWGLSPIPLCRGAREGTWFLPSWWMTMVVCPSRYDAAGLQEDSCVQSAMSHMKSWKWYKESGDYIHGIHLLHPTSLYCREWQFDSRCCVCLITVFL